MSAPGARPKFRIDPTAPPAPPPPPPPAPVAPAAPATLPPRAPTPPPASSSKKKWIIGGAIAVVLILAGAAYGVFGLGVGGLVYPHKYLLEGSEIPHGMRMTDPDQAASGTPCDTTENPCKVNADTLDQLGQAGARPKEGWVEALDTPTASNEPVTILALKFNSNDDATAFSANAARICGLGDRYGAVLRDGDVLVILGATTSGGNIYKAKAVDALKAKVSALTVVCSR